MRGVTDEEIDASLQHTNSLLAARRDATRQIPVLRTGGPMDVIDKLKALIAEFEAAQKVAGAPSTPAPSAPKPIPEFHDLSEITARLKAATLPTYAPASVIDTNRDTRPFLAGLKSAGVVTLGRYISPLAVTDTGALLTGASRKTLREDEARAIAAAGLRVLLICEGWGDFAHGGICAAAGFRDAARCRAYAPKVGIPADGKSAIAFTVDTDASRTEITKLVLPYFEAAKKALDGSYRVVVYGSGAVCDAVVSAGHAEYGFLSCSMGWMGSREYLAANKQGIRQHTPGSNLKLAALHLDLDPDDVRPGLTDIGDCAPFVRAA